MQEQFATSGQTLYPESRGKVMPEVPVGPEEEARRAPRADGETRAKEAKKAENKASDAAREQRDQDRRREELERQREAQAAAKPQKPQAEISFKDAKDVAKVISAIQNERQVIVSSEEFGKFRELLVKAGYELKQVEKMTDAQIVVAAQQLLHSAKIAEPEENDWQYAKDSPNRKAEEALVRKQINKSQSLDEGQFTPEKVRHFLEVLGVEEFKKAAERGGPGAMEAGDLPDEAAVTPEVARYIREVRRTETIPSARARINALANIEIVLQTALLKGELAEDTAGITEIREAVRQRIGVLSEGMAGVAPVMVDSETRVVVENLVTATGAERDRLTRELDGKIARVGEIADAADPANFQEAYLITKAAEQAIRTHRANLERPEMADIRNKLVDFTNKEAGPLALLEQKFRARYNSLTEDEQTAEVGDINREAITFYKQIIGGLGRGLEEAKGSLFSMMGENPTSLREWRVIRTIEGLENAVRVRQLFEGSVIWEEIPETIAKTYGFIESTDLSVEELSATIQEVIGLVRLVPPDTPDARRQRERLVKELEAFRAFHSFRITMQRVNMNAQKVVGVFEQYFTDTTWKDFVERFSKDNKGRQFLDAEGNPVNLFDVAEKLYFERLHTERQTMNLVEGLTLVSIDKRMGNEEFGEIQTLFNRRLTDAEKRELEDLRQEFVKRFQEKGFTLDEWGKEITHTKDVINGWYEETKLLGALAHLGERREEMLSQLEDRLAGLQVQEQDGSVRAVNLAELGNIGFLGSIDYNAYYFAWTLAWSDHDIIRIYGREPKDKNDPMIRAVAYNQSSYLFWGRHIDHVWEFLTDEERGRPGKENEVNEIIRKKYPGKYHGLFDGNRTMVRFFDLFVSKEQKDKLNFDNKVEELMKENDWGDPHSNSVENKWIKEWAQRIVMGELIDSGEVSFADKKFSKTAAEEIKQSQYLMTDLYYDRFFTTTYLNKENYQAYLANPSEEIFFEINNKATKYYSGRNKRLWPWMTLAWRAHWGVASKHRLRLYNKPNLTSAEAEMLTDDFVKTGVMERRQSDHEKRKLFGFNEIGGRIKIGEFVLTEKEYKIPLPPIFGITPFRRARQLLERKRREGFDVGNPLSLLAIFFAGLFAGTWELVKQTPKQITEGLGGR